MQCESDKKTKRDNNSVDADFHAVKGHYQRSAVWAGHQPNCSHVLPVGLCNRSPLPPPPSMTLTPEDTTGLLVGQEGEEMGRNLKGRMRPGEPKMGQDSWVQCGRSRLEEPLNEVGMSCESLI